MTTWENQAKLASTLPHPALLALSSFPPLFPAQLKTLRKKWKIVSMKTETTLVKSLLNSQVLT